MPSGGLRPNAPQNKFGVSGTGGNGSKDGQPLRVAPGGKYGERKASLDQQRSAPMVSAPAQATTNVQPNLPPIVPLTAPSQRPNESVMDGSPVGPGSNTLNIPGQVQDNTQFNAKIESYAPVLQFIQSRPDTSFETRNIISMLLRGN